MKDWYSSRELAGLPGMPGTVQRVNARAERDNWLSQQRQGKGGGREYHISALPEETRRHLLKAAGNTKTETLSETKRAGYVTGQKMVLADRFQQESEWRQRQLSLAASNTLTGAAAQRDTAKHLILAEFATYRKTVGERPHIGLEFAGAYNRGEIDVPPWVKALIPAFSLSSLHAWQRKIRAGQHLAGRYGHRKGAGKIDSQSEVRDLIIAILVEKPHASARHLYQAMEARFSARADVQLPSRRSLERWVGEWKAKAGEVFTAITNPDEWKNRYMVAAGSASARAGHVNALWELDSSPADLMLVDGRHALLAVVDVHSRRGHLLVAKVSKAASIALLIRRAMLDWGVPAEIKTDNGQDYRSAHIARVCTALGIAQTFSAPFSPWEKPHVERFFRTFSHGLAELLPGFIGHDVADRKAIEARKAFSERLFEKDGTVEVRMTAAELQGFCDRWTAEIYGHEHHGGLGTTPFQAAQACREPLRTIEDERALDMLLAEAPGDSWRTVGKKGLRIDKETFIAPEMERYVGHRVQCLYDPDDIGRVYVYGYDRPEDPLNPSAAMPGLHFICVAECPARLGISRDEHAERAAEMRQRQKNRVQDEKKRLKAMARKVDTDSVVDEIMEHKRQQAAAKVTPFPKAKVRHTSPGLTAAADAAQAADVPHLFGKPVTAESVAAALEAVAAAPKTTRPLFESMHQRALWIAEVMMGDRAAELAGEDTEFLRELRRLSPESYRSAADILNLKYLDRWDDYCAFRRAVGWPDARRPKG